MEQAHHIAILHVKLDRVKIILCDYCTRGFLDPDHYENHQKKCLEDNTISEDNDQLTRIYFNLNGQSEWHRMQMEHMQSSTVKLDRVRIYKCGFCSRGFLDHNKLKKHQKKYFDLALVPEKNNNNNQFEKPYECDECGWRFVKQSTLQTHSIIHKPFPHICECGIGYYKKCDLDVHRRLVHPYYRPTAPKIKLESTVIYKSEPESSDEENDKRKKTKPRLKAKLKYKRPKIKINLSQNKENQTFKRNVNKNLVIERDETGKHLCPICAKPFCAKRNLFEHMVVHGGEMHKCDECPKEFPTLQRLSIHKARHAGIKNFECDICGKRFFHNSALRQHTLVHTGEKPYSCSWCPSKFTQPGTLKIHLLRHEGLRNFECEHCDKKFYSKGDLVLHTRTHTKEKPYECKYCGKGFGDPSAKARHELTHTGLKPFKCELCPKAFCDRSAKIVHQRAHQGKGFRCTQCGKKYATRSSWLYHIKMMHEEGREDERYECDHCGQKFMRKQYLVGHMVNVHLMTTEVNCDICSKRMSSLNLKAHVENVHLKGLKNYDCHICGRHFLNKSVRQTHITRTHDQVSDKKYECDYCQKRFALEQDLRRHVEYNHLGFKCECKNAFSTEQKLKEHKLVGCLRCPLCHKAFQYRSKLERHTILFHTVKSEQETYECNYCYKEFSSRSNLFRHIKLCHNPKKIEYSCDHCGASFNRKNTLSTHIWDRHMISLYCDVCLKRFYNEFELNQHKRAGCPVVLLHCTVCDKTFLRASELKNHLKYHGPNIQECGTCKYVYRSERRLKRHLKSAHKPKKVKRKRHSGKKKSKRHLIKKNKRHNVTNRSDNVTIALR